MRESVLGGFHIDPPEEGHMPYSVDRHKSIHRQVPPIAMETSKSSSWMSYVHEVEPGPKYES